MIGAILGDMIGSPYEFDRGDKTKEFPLFSHRSRFTDDTVMTVAVAHALMGISQRAPDNVIRDDIVLYMHRWGRRYADAGYGGRFYEWLMSKSHTPYGSYGNGSAMRVSAVGWLYEDIYTTRRIARLSAEVTHNHPEGIKGAEAVASAIFLARIGSKKDKIKEYITGQFGYDLSRTCDEIRPRYHHVESCQQTVPEAITAFLEGTDFEDVIRTAVSLGGDSDTLACIAGGIAEAYYGVPEELQKECRERIPEDISSVVDHFQTYINRIREKNRNLQGEEKCRDKARNRYSIEKTGSKTYTDHRRIKPRYCHAFINNISFPGSLEEIKDVCIDTYGMYDVEAVLTMDCISWTVPRWAMVGDICLFMHAKTANITISRLKTELLNKRSHYDEAVFQQLCEWLDRGKENHRKYGGKIFAVGRFFDSPEEDTDDGRSIHWKARMYASVGEIWHLKNSIDISEFKKHVTVSSRGAITPVYGKEYAGLKRLLLDNSKEAPSYFLSSIAADASSSKINRDNWLEIAYDYRHSFI